MGKIIFIVGGARSGKSAYALKLAKEYKTGVAYIATGETRDDEMRRRIAAHRKSRPRGWKTFEVPVEVSAILEKSCKNFRLVIIDCLTLWVSNMMMGGRTGTAIETEAEKMVSRLRKIKADSIIVSNEVGLGIVPNNRMARDFRDCAGRTNQVVAQKADEVIFMVAGIQWRIK